VCLDQPRPGRAQERLGVGDDADDVVRLLSFYFSNIDPPSESPLLRLSRETIDVSSINRDARSSGEGNLTVPFQAYAAA
jgi:hypothetical protein